RLLASSVAGPESIEPAGGATPLEAGWNRLVRSVRSEGGAAGLDQRVGAAVAEYRQRRGDDILNALTDGIAVTDASQRITCANNALYSILHLDPAGACLRGVSIEEALAREAGLDPTAGILEPGHLRHRVVGEIAFSRADCHCTLRVCRTPLATETGASQGSFVWSVRDVTQQKLADKMRDQFVNAATHELRTPMANIKAYAETLALGEVDDVEQQKMFCNVINEEVTRLARFIDDLLHLSRMEAGATTLQLQVTEMGRLLEETARKVRPQMVQKHLKFDVELPARLPELVVDKDKLTVAVINLLGNAAKYTPEGGSVQMRVSLAQNFLHIEVEDTGIGIAQEELPRVLDKFYRSSDPRVHAETGSGLGLSLTQEIVRLHGGKLALTSELNKGSKFTISLPVTAE
ncbi:MAG: ATP-binding protein, partial [Thermoguttaceae bacterium]